MSKVAARVLEELVRPLRELDITDTEFACLRAIVFFAPGQSQVTDVSPLPHLNPFPKPSWFHGVLWKAINNTESSGVYYLLASLII